MTNADTTGLRPAIFMDRDNTLTVDAKGYTWRLSDFALIDGAAASLALFHKLGLPVFVVTNQGGIGKGLYSQDDMQHFHDRLAAEAIAAGGMITDFAFCPHHPDAHDPALRTPCRAIPLSVHRQSRRKEDGDQLRYMKSMTLKN